MPRATAAAALLAFVPAIPAYAQIAGNISIESDRRLRGFSLSAGRPTATAQVSYDHFSGVYANASATTVLTRDEELRFLGVQGNLGVARRIGPSWSVDGGIVHTEFRAPYEGERSHKYTEVYLGVTRDPVSVRAYYSPNYFRSDVRTLYGEIEASFAPARNWQLNAHVGGLAILSSPEAYRARRERYYDWRLELVRQLGHVEVHAALSGGGPGKQFYGGKRHSRTALTAGASWSF